MELQERPRAHGTGLPDQDSVLTASVWHELHDFLTLALDALGDKPTDFTPAFLENAIVHLRLATRITHGAAKRGSLSAWRATEPLQTEGRA